MEQIKQCGLAMYTVHKSAEADLYGTFCRLGKMGYRGIEFYGEPAVEPELLKRSLSDSGLSLTGWHVEWRNLQPDRIKETTAYLQRIGCPIAVIPCLGGKWQVAHGPKEECREIWLRYAEQMNAISEQLAYEGIRTAYHNHEHEFQLEYEGEKVFDLLFDRLSEQIIIEFDSGNCIEGGDDPLRVLKKYENREILLHLKPYSHTNGFNTVLGAADDANDWKSILNPETRTYLWLLVESENEVLPEFENAERCLEGLKQILRREVEHGNSYD